MSDEIETSEGGSRIFRHQPRKHGFELAIGDSDTIEAVAKHIEQHIGAPGMVWHELVSDLVHIDIHTVAPGPDRNYCTLVTSGMSDKPMTPPPELAERQFAELVLALPPNWPMTQEDLKNETHYWPIRWLKILARLPHEYDTWLDCGHTVPNGDPPQPFADGTKMCGVVLAPPTLFGEKFAELALPGGKIIRFHAVLPLYSEELDFKLKQGADALFERFDRLHVTELLDPRRANVCKKRFFGLF